MVCSSDEEIVQCDPLLGELIFTILREQTFVDVSLVQEFPRPIFHSRIALGKSDEEVGQIPQECPEQSVRAFRTLPFAGSGFVAHLLPRRNKVSNLLDQTRALLEQRNIYEFG